jgi:hypothetical protein
MPAAIITCRPDLATSSPRSNQQREKQGFPLVRIAGFAWNFNKKRRYYGWLTG